MKYLSASEAADYLGVKTSTIYAYVSRGLLDSMPAPGDSRRRRYRKSDLDRLARRSSAHGGHGAAAADALQWGAPSLDTAISKITYAGPAYRGRLARHLVVEGRSFEAVAEWLWTGTIPEKHPRWLTETPRLLSMPEAVDDQTRPVDLLRVAVLLAGLENPARFASSEEAQRDCGRKLVAGAVHSLAAHYQPKAAIGDSVAELIAAAFGVELSEPVRRSLNAALVVVADHELNASTFSARVTASTGADLYACVGSALATFTGPRHGGACGRCDALLAETRAAESARSVLLDRVQRGEAPPGFEHPLYPHGDPRFPILRRALDDLDAEAVIDKVDALSNAAGDMELGSPTVDLGLAALGTALGMPRGAATAVFAVGRMAGWIAHAIEQRDQDFLLRPRANYVGD